ncbi:MAG: hypothetical protein KAG34_00840, partial [Cocleimonas sp.]|nr:hypothetical protein [Cocleimonas sp.]
MMLNIRNEDAKNLYEKLLVFPFVNEDAAFSFLDRLADENAWERPHAENVLEEYRRFIVLLVFTDHKVTPSDSVDQAWHLHMLYSHSYWSELCTKTLGKHFHHMPTEGGEEEREKFKFQYKLTLESYKNIFGEEAPSAIWPEVKERFSKDIHFQRTKKVKPKRNLSVFIRNAMAILAFPASYVFTESLIIAFIV